MIRNLVQDIQASVDSALRLIQQYPQRLTTAIAAFLMVGTGATFAVANLTPDGAQLATHTVVESVETLPLQAQIDALQERTLRLFRSETTRSTDTSDSLLKRLGVFDPQAAAFMRTNSAVQSALLGRAGRNVTIEADDSNALISLKARWSPQDDGMFKRLSLKRSGQGFQAQIETLPLVASSRLASGTIKSSLFAATDDAHIPDAIAVQMAEIFSGDIDFHRSLRKGDRFSVVYETLEGDGEPMRAGRVLSAEFVNAGKTHQAMWFQDPLAQSAIGADMATPAHKGGYYTLAGESLRRAFLASPMEFSRVTSGFKMRFHPILQTWRAHLGVDYAAPTGTAVRSVGNGVVDFAGVQNGFGNVVIVKHDNANSTVYAHLSRILVRKGQGISQGQNVGAVGMTGWATGPHLHFEFRVNGAHRDPKVLASLSGSGPVNAAARPLFSHLAANTRTQLAAAAQMQMVTTQ